MKKLLVIITILLIGSIVHASAQNGPTDASSWIVVDRGTRNKTLNDYVLLTRDAIQTAWVTPLDLPVPSAVKGKVRINYTIANDGRLESVELIRGSGNEEMDRSLMHAIRLAAPFPRFPDDIGADRVTIRANFVVAETPAIPVTTVEYPTDKKGPAGITEPGADEPKVLWGVPAESAHKGEPNVDREPPAPAPPAKKYRWGLQQ
jgi:TonB family protein